MEKEEYLSTDQLRLYCNVSRKFVEDHCADRRLPGMVKVGRLWRFNRREVDKRLQSGELLLPKREG
jgi:excisionase family DNA binding protein